MTSPPKTDPLSQNWVKNEDLFQDAKILRKSSLTKKSQYTSEQIVFALWQAESGIPVDEISQKLGIVE